MQHLHSSTREGDVENEATTQDLLQRRTKKLEAIHRFSASFQMPVGYVHDNEVEQAAGRSTGGLRVRLKLVNQQEVPYGGL